MVQDDWSDEAIYQGLRKRNTHALEALISRYVREITYYIRNVLDGVGTPQDAEECSNDLFVVAWQEIDSFDAERGSLRTWLTMRAKYIALDRKRLIQRRQAQVTSLDSGEHPAQRSGDSHGYERRSLRPLNSTHLTDQTMERLLEQQELREELIRAIDALPTLDRYLVYMRYLKLANTEEIATRTGLTRHAIDTRLWRARKVLREALEEREQPEQAAEPTTRANSKKSSKAPRSSTPAWSVNEMETTGEQESMRPR